MPKKCHRDLKKETGFEILGPPLWTWKIKRGTEPKIFQDKGF